MKIVVFSLLFASGLWAQAPSCQTNPATINITAIGRSVYTNNSSNPRCSKFAVTWTATAGISALSVTLEGSDNGSSWTAFTGTNTLLAGTVNPSTALSGTIIIQAQSQLAFIGVHFTSITGSGGISFQLQGYNQITSSTSSGGGCAALGGDLSGTCAAATVIGVEGAPIPTNAGLIGTNSMGQLTKANPAAVTLLAITTQSAANAVTGAFAATTDGGGDTHQGSCAIWAESGLGAALGYLTFGADSSVSGVNCLMGNAGSYTIISGETLQPTGTGVIIANQVNGAVIPASAAALASNASRQVIAATVSGTGSTVLLQGSPTITTPTIGDFTNSAHSHQNAAGGSQLTESALNLTDNTTNNVSTTAHGFAPKLPNDATKFLNGTGTYSVPSGSGGGGGGVVTYSGPSLSILSGTSFCPIGGGGACSATETNVDIDSSAAATISNLYVQLSQALGVGNSVVVTWRKNASSQTITCTISGGSATSCNDTTHSFNVATGDLLDYQLVFSGTIVVTPTVTVMSAFGTSNVGVTSVFGNAGPTVGATGDINATGRVVGINSVPLCTGFTPTNGQNLQYTTASSPNPCYTAATASGGTTVNAPQSIATAITCTSSVFFQPFSDSQYFNQAYCNGSSTLTYYMAGQQVTPIGVTGATYSFTNQGSAAVAKQTNGVWTLNFPQHGSSDSLNVYDAAIPAAPSSQVFRFNYAEAINTNNGGVGISLRESATGKLIACFMVPGTGTSGTSKFTCSSWTNTTTFSASLGTLGASMLVNFPVTIKVTVASGLTGAITISFSPDGGANYFQAYTAAKNAFFTVAPDNIGWVGNNNVASQPDFYLTAISVN